MSRRREVPLGWHDRQEHDVGDREQLDLEADDEDRDEAQFRRAAWLPQTNRTDLTNRYTATDRKGKRPLTRRGSVLRDDAVHGAGGQGVALTWGEVTRRWEEWVGGYDEAAAFFEVENDDGETETRKIDLENRFSETYSARYYAKMKALERGVLEDFNDPHTIMLPALTGSAVNAEGGPRCPVDFMDDLLGSWDAVKAALHRVLEGRRWEYVRILEPHGGEGPNHGYPHVHVAVFVDGPVDEELVAQRAVDAHVRGCTIAEREAHDPGAVTCERVTERERAPEGSDDPEDEDRGVTNLGAYLTEYFGAGYGEPPDEQPERVRMFYALLWATNRQRFTCSNGAQDFMQPPESDEEPADVRFLGVSFNGAVSGAVKPAEDDDEPPVPRMAAVPLPEQVDPPP